MNICENCEKEHDGSYGSGRFCCKECARSFSTKNKRKEISIKVSKSLKGIEPWNKGKTNVYSKETLQKFSDKRTGKQRSKETRKKISISSKGKTITKETREKLSNVFKSKVIDGTHKGWQSRSIESYPEKFFTKVLKNYDLFDKCIKEYKVSKKDLGLNDSSNYFLDFFFPDKMIDLEIDGKQHWKDNNRIESDKQRDFALKANGYKVYRIKWISINTVKGKEYIQNEINKFLKFYKDN